MDELQETVDTLIDVDEPEALLATLQSVAQRHKGERWQKLARVLAQAQVDYDDGPPKFRPPPLTREQILQQTAAQVPPDSEAKPE